MLLPELISPKATGLSFDRNSAEAAAARQSSAILAARIGAIRGDLWANAAFTGARFMWTDRSTSLDRTRLDQLEQAKANAETALALAPINGAAWLFLAKLPAAAGRRKPRRHASRNVLFHRPQRAGTRPLASRAGGNLKRTRGQGPPGVRQKRSSGDLEPPAGIPTGHHCRLSQRLAAESADF